METIVKHCKNKVLSDCNAAINLKRIDLNESSNLLNNKDVNMGFGTMKMLLDLWKKDLITVKEHSQFLKDSKHFIISLLPKLFERIPHNFDKAKRISKKQKNWILYWNWFLL